MTRLILEIYNKLHGSLLALEGCGEELCWLQRTIKVVLMTKITDLMEQFWKDPAQALSRIAHPEISQTPKSGIQSSFSKVKEPLQVIQSCQR